MLKWLLSILQILLTMQRERQKLRERTGAFKKVKEGQCCNLTRGHVTVLIQPGRRIASTGGILIYVMWNVTIKIKYSIFIILYSCRLKMLCKKLNQ